MGLFRRRQEKQMTEKNEINNNTLKEELMNKALQLLVEGQDYDQLDQTTCEFGYLFDIEGHGLEALFKITTDKGIAYFAAQKESLMRIDFNEELFETTTETFLSLHQS